jgi:hypothetical protein
LICGYARLLSKGYECDGLVYQRHLGKGVRFREYVALGVYVLRPSMQCEYLRG